jgi:hypothetical protein
MLLKIDVDQGKGAVEGTLLRRCGDYFQLQFGISVPGPVSGRFCEPSPDNMVQTLMWSAFPSDELA